MISGVNQGSISSYRVTPVPSVLRGKTSDDSHKKSDKIKPVSHIKLSTTELSREDQERIRELKSRDTEVRSHEQAHVAAGGQYVTGGPTYSFQQGPDGHRYAVGGEVGIDASAESDPEATIRKMQAVRAAALAPAQPSGQDRKVAASAARNTNQARAELREEHSREGQEQSAIKKNEATWAPSSAGEIFDVRA